MARLRTAPSLFDARSLGVLAILLAAFAAALHAMGRVALCSCGFGVWTSSAWSNETSQLIADPYSSSHLLHGVIFFFALLPFSRYVFLQWRLVLAVLLEIGWELLENSPLVINRYRAGTAATDYMGDSILNSLGDVAFVVLGFWLASRFGWKWMLAAFVVIELVMLALIRDNLTLNVLMLIHPVDAIRAWQMAGQ